MYSYSENVCGKRGKLWNLSFNIFSDSRMIVSNIVIDKVILYKYFMWMKIIFEDRHMRSNSKLCGRQAAHILIVYFVWFYLFFLFKLNWKMRQLIEAMWLIFFLLFSSIQIIWFVLFFSIEYKWFNFLNLFIFYRHFKFYWKIKNSLRILAKRCCVIQ